MKRLHGNNFSAIAAARISSMETIILRTFLVTRIFFGSGILDS